MAPCVHADHAEALAQDGGDRAPHARAEAVGVVQQRERTRTAPIEQRDLDTAMGTIREGTRAALRFEVRGIVDGRVRLVVEHVTRMHDELAPDWPQSDGGYQIVIEGVPRIVCNLDMEDEHGDHAVGGVVLTATRIVNAIPHVVRAEPRPLTALDIPLVTGRGLLAR